MAHVFRYPLTRFCLRSGTLTLPRAMAGLFPESGEVNVLDTVSGQELTVTVENARTVSGFGELFKRHQLAVNDELAIEVLDDGRFAVSATAHQSSRVDPVEVAVKRALDEVCEAEVPVSVAEIRALFPDLPEEVDLHAHLESDGRFAMRHGRWHNAAALAAEDERTSVEATSDVVAAASEPVAGAVAESLAVSEPQTVAATANASSGSGASLAAGLTSGMQGSALAGGSHGSVPANLGAAPTGSGQSANGGEGHGMGSYGTDDDSRWSVFERRTPATEADAGAITEQLAAAAAAEDDDGASLEASELANRLRRALVPLGFRLEPLGRGQLIVHADMGRRSYRVLAQLLSRTQRLDWADLLARRRTSGVRYLAVIGDHRDLLRLTNPADLARATLWSWQALDRMSLLHRSVPLSPIELEAHFERDGLFEQGLQLLEATVSQRVAERGAMSEVLARLAVMRSPSVFLLEELAGELGMSRELALRILERLADTPFHLIAKVDPGEFVLRQRVSDALGNVSDYASSLRARLPSKQVERLVASGEPDLLTDSDDLDHLFGAGGAEA